MSGDAPSSLSNSYPVEHLNQGHSFGNSCVYATLNNLSDVSGDRNTVRYGLRDAYTQRRYLLGWEVDLATAAGQALAPLSTTFAPSFQETRYACDSATAHKQFFVPFENNYLRAAHFILQAGPS